MPTVCNLCLEREKIALPGSKNSKNGETLVNLLTAVLVFKIGRFFLNYRNAVIATLVYALSTYSIFFQASGRKETLMLFWVIVSQQFPERADLFIKGHYLCLFDNLRSISWLFLSAIIVNCRLFT
jgi:hypothetical protein